MYAITATPYRLDDRHSLQYEYFLGSLKPKVLPWNIAFLMVFLLLLFAKILTWYKQCVYKN